MGEQQKMFSIALVFLGVVFIGITVLDGGIEYANPNLGPDDADCVGNERRMIQNNCVKYCETGRAWFVWGTREWCYWEQEK